MNQPPTKKPRSRATGTRSRAARRERAWSVGLPLLAAVCIAAAWQFLTTGHASSTGVLMPAFTDFLGALGRVITRASFWSALWTSESALLIGFVAATVVGVPLGLALGRSRWLDAVVVPYLDIAVISPLAIVAPMVLLVFGPTAWARMVIIFIFALPFIAMPCRTGAMTVPPELLAMARSYGASTTQAWRAVLLPAALPSILNGLRQGLAHALTGMIIIELTFLAVGVGRLIQDYQNSFDAAAIFAIAFFIVAEGVLIMTAFHAVESRYRRRMQS